jgi:WD40 repeat protein
MSKIIKISSLLILFAFCFVTINSPVGNGESLKRDRLNRLKKIYFIPRHELIVGGCESEPNGSIRFWKLSNGELKEVLDLGKNKWADALAISSDGGYIVASLIGAVEIGCYSLIDKEWLWKVKWVEEGVVGNAVRFAPNDRKVVVVGVRNIVTYDAKTGGILKRQEDSYGFSAGFPEYRTRFSTISPSARYAAFWQGHLEHDEGWWSSKNIWVVVRDIEEGRTIAKQGKIQSKYKNCSAIFTPDEKNVVLGSMDGRVRVWSIADQKVNREWQAFWNDNPIPFEKNPAPNLINSMIVSNDCRYFATMGFDIKSGFTIKIWDYATNNLLHEFVKVISSSLGMGSGYPMVFSPDGKYFAFERQGNLCLYDTQTWQEKWCVPSWPEGKD